MRHVYHNQDLVHTGGGHLEVYKKEGFPYVKKFINPKALYSKLVTYAKKGIDDKDNAGDGQKKRTFAIHDNQGLIHTHLREILLSKGWHEVSINSEYADFAWVGATIGTNYLKYDKSIYEIKTILKNLLVGGGVKGDTDNKDVITNKSCLYTNMKKQFPNIYKKYMMKTYAYNRLYDYKEGDVVIIRPIGAGAGGGADVYVVNTSNEFNKSITKLKRYKQVIITKYIVNPLLLKTLSYKKFHLRMYLMICTCKDGFKWHFWDKGKIITAELPYVPDDFTNPLIHDTHFKSTRINKYFPDDLNLEKSVISKLYKQMNEIMEASANIIKDHAFSYPESKYAFEVFGVDMMITDDFVVKLIEINARHDYGVDDLKKKDGSKHNQFCSAFFDWVYEHAIIPVFGGTEKGGKDKGKGKGNGDGKRDKGKRDRNGGDGGNRGGEGDEGSGEGGDRDRDGGNRDGEGGDKFISYERYKLDRERFEIKEDIRFNGKYISIYIPNYKVYDKNNIDLLVDYFTEESRIKAQKNKDDPSLYTYYHEKDLLKDAIKWLEKHNKKITLGTLRDSFYEFKMIYNASPESTIFYILLWKLLYPNKTYDEFSKLRILDGAGGYGTRLLAAIVLNMHYIGVEPNTMSTAGFKEMIDMFGDSKKQIMYEDGLPNAEGVNSIKNNTMDIVMFSPPMYDGEIYSNDDKQSTNMFKDYNTWKNKFLYESLRILWSKLSIGGFIVFQSIRYNLIRELIEKEFEDARFLGVISRKTYSGRFKPNWIWTKVKK
jgi:hypothetical protein